jgi:HD-like signal output (HDOD) protein
MGAARLECARLLRRSDFAIEEAVSVVEDDPALAACVLVAANQGSNERARSVREAATRLGSESLRRLLLEATAAPARESRDSRIRDAYDSLWRHARAVGSAARLAAMMFRAGDPDEAHLAGLLHDVGKLVAGSLLVEPELRLVGTKTKLWLDPEAWVDVVESVHLGVGSDLAEAWKLPDAVVRVVAHTSRYDETAPRSVVNCVGLANALAIEAGIFVGHLDEELVAGAVREGQSLLSAPDRGLDTLRSELLSFRSPGASRLTRRAEG